MSVFQSWFKEIWTRSWTTVLGWFKIWFGVTLAIGSYLGHTFNDPGVQSAMSKLNIPAEVGLGIAILGALVLISESHAQ